QYKDIFKEDSGKSDIVAQTSALNAYNQEIKRASVEKQKQAQFDKETESIIKQIVQLENERYRLLKQSDSVGDNEASVLRKQADAIKEKSSELSKQQGLAERMNSTQTQSLSNLQKENEVAREYSSTLARAKDGDATRAQAQANAYREIKSQMQDVYSIQEKIAHLTALEKNGTLTGKEETKLQSLRQELSVRQDIMTATKNQHVVEDNLTSTQKDSLSSLQKEKSYKLESARATAEINAEARKTNQLYDEIASSMKKVHTLSNELADAGSSQSRVIRNIIGLEERRQNAIRETLSLQGRVNNSREDELNTMRKQNNELQEQNAERSTTRRYDNLTTGGGMLGGMLNPMSIANDARQAAMTFYDSIAPIDAALVNIAKVAEEPQEQLDEFATTIYDTASTVGKSAEEYATSVERWLTAGKTLNDSVELSKVSVMGAFVGNIGESEMVDYMSVPLNAYKKDALEASDIINAMNEVANKNAIEMDDMGSAYKRAASTSAQAGTTFAQLTGIITAGQEATRVGGETMGTAVKAMDVNIGKIGSRITSMDNTKFEFLESIGVNVKDSNGELKSTFKVLEDLNKVWKNLNSDQKSTAGFYLAGKQFQNVFSGIMGNWDVVMKATNEAQSQVDLIDKKSGSAFKEFGKQQDSVQFKAANLKNSWAEFLNTVAGGKDGVVTVMAALNDGLQMATKLAENDAIRGIATNLLKVIATLTVTTAISKFFSVITAGSRSTIASLKGVTEGLKNARAAASISKASKVAQVATTSNKSFRLSRKSEAVGKVAKSYKVVDDVGDIARSASSIKNVSNTVEKTTKATKGLGSSLLSVGSGVASVGSKFVSFGAKAIPVVGGVFTAIEILEAFGVPVWGTLFKTVKKFTGGTDEAKESLKSYQVQQESTKQSLSENKLFTGAIKKNNDLIKSYKEMADAKRKSLEEFGQQNGWNPGDVDRNLNLNSDEFENLKKQFNERATELGIKTRITINNWADIQAKFKELEEVNIKVTGVEVSKLGGDLKKLGLYDNVEKQFDAFNKKSQSEMDKKVKRYEGSKKYVSAGSDESKYYDQQIKEAERYKEGKGDFYGSGEMK
ncbi:MAG: phage tail tape measure protein, partial [Bacilli bacterium]|nr:phage tail tape measure protein [Bacilli bacterium]